MAPEKPEPISGQLPLCLTHRGHSTLLQITSHLSHGSSMRLIKVETNRRRQPRTQAVLPVRVRGTDASGVLFEGLAHTLDLTPTGAKLGAMRHPMKALDTLVVLYRQRRIEFTIIWSKLLDGACEYQVGLQTIAQQSDPWGLGVSNHSAPPAMKASAASVSEAA